MGSRVHFVAGRFASTEAAANGVTRELDAIVHAEFLHRYAPYRENDVVRASES
jgi:hypothetical protein